MKHLEAVKQQAIASKKILDEYFSTLRPEEIRFYRNGFHLRPTSSGDTTIVSTLDYAPMRGMSVSTGNLLSKLKEASGVIGMSTRKIKDRQIYMDKIGFPKRTTEDFSREERMQASLIRVLMPRPEETEPVLQGEVWFDMQLVASDFALFGQEKPMFTDVLAYRAGVLYDIEVISRETKGIKQIAEKVSHISAHLSEYADCLYEFPNSPSGTIEEIKEVCGIALVPCADLSKGELERACRESGVSLWEYDSEDDYRIRGTISE
jgi:hypothetical protein